MKTLVPRLGFAIWTIMATAGAAAGADHTVEKLEQGPPEELATAVSAQLNTTGVKVLRGSRTVCEVWLHKKWPLKTFKPALDVNYPFTPGQLVGAIRFPRSGSDFRQQEIEKGVYTLRYAQQPVDGAHVGTSPTRDFLLLVKAEEDQSPVVMDYEPLTQASAEAAGTAHPALLSLKRTVGDAKAPSIRNDQQHDWWIVRLASEATADDKTQPLSMDLVVVGAAEE